jgi:hypothetical protein
VLQGLTDELLTWQTKQLLARETGRRGIAVLVRPELRALLPARAGDEFQASGPSKEVPNRKDENPQEERCAG